MKSGLRLFFVMAIVLSVVAINFMPVQAAEKTVVVYGPETFIRGTGKPVETVKTFSLRKPRGEYTMTIQNGDKGARVTSAVIKVNGQVVLGPDSFNEKMETAKVTLYLQEKNELAVTLNGKPGSKIIITIDGLDELEAKDVAELVLEASRKKDAATVRQYAQNPEIQLVSYDPTSMEFVDYCRFDEFTLATYQLSTPQAQTAMAADSSEAKIRFICNATYSTGQQYDFGQVNLVKTPNGWKVVAIFYSIFDCEF